MTLIALSDVGDLEARIRSELPEPFIDVTTIEPREDAAATARAIAESGAIMVVLGGPDDDRIFDIAGVLDREHPDIAVLAATKQRAAAWRRAVETGVRGLIPPGCTDEELRDQLEQAIEAARRHHDVTTPLGRRIITVASPKGGVGKTVLSTNLAVALARRWPRQVALIDLDLQFGDVAPAMALTPELTMSDAIAAVADKDTQVTVKVFLTKHDSGVLVLCAPQDAASADEITAEQTTEVISLIASEFRWVIIDTGAGLTPHALSAMDVSTDIMLVSDMDVLSVRNVRRAVEALDQLEMRRQQRHLVLNRANSKVGLSKEDVAVAAGMDFDSELPSSRAVPRSLNQGWPLLVASPRAPFSKRIEELADHLANGHR